LADPGLSLGCTVTVWGRKEKRGRTGMLPADGGGGGIHKGRGRLKFRSTECLHLLDRGRTLRERRITSLKKKKKEEEISGEVLSREKYQKKGRKSFRM